MFRTFLFGVTVLGISSLGWAQSADSPPPKPKSPTTSRIPPLPPPLTLTGTASPVLLEVSGESLAMQDKDQGKDKDKGKDAPVVEPRMAPDIPVIGERDGRGAGADQPSTVGPVGPPGEGRYGPPGPPGPGAPANAFIEGRTLPVTNAIGSPQSASQGTITQADLRDRPLLRTTDIFEQIPGMIFSNETNGVDAQTMFLRGFNIDHGTDFAFFVDGVPMNLVSNPHAQGFTDINFVIPELVATIDFGKGPYYAKAGNFATAGYADVQYFDALPYGIAKVEAGSYDWVRTVIADSAQVGRGTLLYGVQYNYFDNAFSIPEHMNKTSAVFRYTFGDEDNRLTVSTYIYNGQGTSEPIVPLRLVQSGQISRFTNLSPSDFIVANRFLINGAWQHRWDYGGLSQANVYGNRYTLSLFENSSGFTSGPQGDQVQQVDQRWQYGTKLSHSWPSFMVGDQVAHTVGLQVRQDNIAKADTNNTQDRAFVSLAQSADILETDTGLFYQNEAKWSEKVRTVLGLRGEFYTGEVTNNLIPVNSGEKNTKMFLPKGSLVLGPWEQTEFYLNGGYSFHSNNAGGAVATVDAAGDPVPPAPLLIQARGAEVGIRSQRIPDLTTGVALWQMHLDSELVFDPVEQATEAIGPSDRYGIEFTNSYQLLGWLSLNGDYAWSHGRLLEVDPATPGNRIPNSITTVFSGGPSVRLPNGLFANLRYRYWGPRPLIADNSASSRATNLFELSTGYECQRYTINLQILNLFDSNGHEIDFFDTTFYPNFGDAAPTADKLFKPLQPFSARVSYTLRW